MMNGDTAASTSSKYNNNNDALMNSNDGDEEDVTLSALVIRALKAADDILEGSGSITVKDKDAHLTSVLSSLSLCSSLIRHLSLLSTNETIDEVSTPTLRCFLVPYYTALCEMQTRTKDYNARIAVLNLAKDQLQGFMDKVEQYAVVDHDKRKRLYLEKGSLGNDPARRREAKILQYKEEKALKAQIDQLNAQLAAKSTSSIASGSVNHNDASSYEDEYLRPLLLTQISYAYIRAHTELTSISTELELLSHAPNMSELPSSRSRIQDTREKSRENEDDRWRLDTLPSSSSISSHRQLVDSSGRILRPFTILPSASSGMNGLSSTSSLDTRLRLQGQVFGSSHRLPTMSIDDYLEMEQERGNILKGGGARNTEESKREASDKKAWEEEEDTYEGYERAEIARLKAAEWDEYKDSHKKGEGNRMNRG